MGGETAVGLGPELELGFDIVLHFLYLSDFFLSRAELPRSAVGRDSGLQLFFFVVG